MRRSVLPGLIIVVLLLTPRTALANGFERAIRQMLFSFIAMPLILMGIALVCAILSKSRFALLYYPAIGGLIAAAFLPVLLGVNFLLGLFVYGIVYGLVGLIVGGLSFFIRAGVAEHRTRDKPTGKSKEKP
jgi:hypothetical protein